MKAAIWRVLPLTRCGPWLIHLAPEPGDGRGACRFKGATEPHTPGHILAAPSALKSATRGSGTRLHAAKQGHSAPNGALQLDVLEGELALFDQIG
jgi:hypothetical protein